MTILRVLTVACVTFSNSEGNPPLHVTVPNVAATGRGEERDTTVASQISESDVSLTSSQKRTVLKSTIGPYAVSLDGNIAHVVNLTRTKVFKAMKFHDQKQLSPDSQMAGFIADNLGYDLTAHGALFRRHWESQYKKVVKRQITDRRSTVCESIRKTLLGM